MAVQAKFVADFTTFFSALQNADTKLRDFSSGVGRIDKDLAKFGDSFSGRKIIQDASLATKAVNDLGGVSKLTSSEQQRLSNMVTESIAKFKALGQEAPAELRKIQSELNAQQSLWSRATKSVEEHATSFKAVGTAAAGVVAGIAAVTVGIGQLILRGSEVSDIHEAFQKLNGTIGNDSAEVLKRLRTAFDGTISDFDLMKMSNEALGKGLQANADQFELLADASRVLADQGLATSTDAFQALSQAMATGKTKGAELLIGIVENTKAYTDYAAALGKETKDMTEAEKAAATQIAIQERLGEIVRINGKVVSDAGDAWDKAKVFVSNFRDALAETVTNSPVVQSMLASIQAGLNAAFGADKEAMVASLTSGVGSFMIGLVSGAQFAVSAAGVLGQAWSGLQLIFSGFFSVVSAGMLGVVAIVDTVVSMAAKIPGIGSQFAGMSASIHETRLQLSGMQQSFHDQAAEAWEGVKGNNAFTQAADRIGGVLAQAKAGMIAAQSAQAGANTETSKGAPLLRQLGQGYDDAGGSAAGAAGGVRQFTQALVEAQSANDKAIANSKAGIAFEMGGFDLKSMLKPQQLVDAAPIKLSPSWDWSNLPPSLKRELGNITPVVTEGLMPAATAATNQLRTAISGGLTSAFQSIGPAILGALQGGGDVVKSVGSAFGGSLTKHIFGGEAMQKGITSIFGQTLGGAFNAILPGIGTMIGPLIGKIGSFFKGLFGPSAQEMGGRNAAAEFKTSVESMLSDAQKLELAQNNVSGAMRQQVALHIAIRDAAKDRAIGEQQASQLVQRLWAAEKDGPEAVKRVIEEINQILSTATPAAVQEVGASVVSTVSTMAASAQQSMADLRKSLWFGSGGGGGGNTGDNSENQTFGQDFIRGFVGANGITDIGRVLAGGTINNAAEDAKAQNWAKNWIADHAGEMEAAQQANRDRGNESAQKWASMGFATGTGGRYLDFGAGTPTTLHGKERVMTEAEGQAEQSGWMALQGELAALRAEFRMLPKMLIAAQQMAR